MTRTRSEFSAKVRVAAFERSEGRCESCGVTIRPGNGPEYDHCIPDALGGPSAPVSRAKRDQESPSGGQP